MIKVFSPAEIRAAETAAMDAGVDEITLMKRAAEGLLSVIPRKADSIGILCGKGNNAGDGYALAHLLHLSGRKPILYRFSDRLTPAAAHYFGLCEDDCIPVLRELGDSPFSDCDYLVDCLFGIGFHGEVDSPWKEIILAANASSLPILAADIPSGLSAESGLGEIAIRATQTLAIGGFKYGHFLGRGRDLCGTLSLAPIGLSPMGGVDCLENADLHPMLSPRPHYCHKGTYGTVALLGGSRLYSGAPRLSALAAASLRCGCGIARLAIPACIVNSALPYLLEGTLCPMPCENGQLLFDDAALQTAFGGASSAAIGMGMGRSEENAKILQWALQTLNIPLVIDADGLNTLAQVGVHSLLKTDACCVLTPHPKEFSRLSGLSMGEILAHPIDCARKFAKEHGCILLLKGTGTVITDGEQTYLVARGSGGMATAGSGDVLSGVLAALLAWSAQAPLFTVAAGAYLCGLAGEIAAERVGTISQLASDTASALPDAIRQITST